MTRRQKLYAALAVVLIVPATFALMVVGGVIRIGGAEIEAQVAERSADARVRQRIFDPRNVISNYEAFFNQCNSIVALNEQITTAQSTVEALQKDYDASADTFGEGQREITRLRQVVLGLTNQRASIASEYNSASAQYTRNQFKDASLPFRIGPPDGVAFVSVTCN